MAEVIEDSIKLLQDVSFASPGSEQDHNIHISPI